MIKSVQFEINVNLISLTKEPPSHCQGKGPAFALSTKISFL